ncbi:unnamed protein product [Acanthoscelides obtectus]|uniref:Protein SON n=1 Tax=Acanthoscelides obtectus TaxID=200917 RepID=A0A9P0MEP3_ACAOB|nr:unnamed protein product [Acanthoscelides obtectus]CAK1629961.1 Protein SON [Acanthoscelides obtectus]
MSSSDNEKEQKPSSIPSKSSMEILSELFSTFHAEPPLIIKREKSEESGKKHKKKKKHKHKDRKHKKKDKKKRRSGSSSSGGNSEVDLAKILIRQTKAEQKIKIEGTSVELDLNNIKQEVKKEDDIGSRKIKAEYVKVKKENTDAEAENKNQTSIDDENNAADNRNGKNKIVIKDLKSSSVSEVLKEKEREHSEGEIVDSDDDRKKKRKSKHKHKSDRDSRKRSRSRSKERSDKRAKTKSYSSRDKDRQNDRHYSHNDFYKGHSSRSKDDERNRERDRHRDKSRDRYKDEYDKEVEEYKRSRNRELVKDDGFYKGRDTSDRDSKWTSSRDRYREREHERDRKRRSTSKDRESSSKIDKKKLLEIARRNAINMMKSGNLPAALSLGPQAQEKVIAAIKSGGKTIEELTDFCKTLSKKEELGELSSLSEKDDSDSDTDKPFHHPFQIKDRPTSITMNIKNSVPLPVKSLVERTSELRMQFPVSSGQQHRKGEEWLPVSPATANKAEDKQAPPRPTTSVPLADVPLPPLPIEAPPAAPLLPAVVPPVAKAVAAVVAPAIVPPAAVAPPVAAPASVVALPGPQVFPLTVAGQQQVDISSIVSQRLTAMRKLQENPHDVQALTQMHKINREMQSWASSKQQFGQFTGTTGANILSQAELSSGFQAWAKKVLVAGYITVSFFAGRYSVISGCTERTRCHGHRS